MDFSSHRHKRHKTSKTSPAAKRRLRAKKIAVAFALQQEEEVKRSQNGLQHPWKIPVITTTSTSSTYEQDFPPLPPSLSAADVNFWALVEADPAIIRDDEYLFLARRQAAVKASEASAIPKNDESAARATDLDGKQRALPTLFHLN